MRIACLFADERSRWAWLLLLPLLSCSSSAEDETEIRKHAERAFSEARSAVTKATESVHVLPQGADTRDARKVLDADLEDLQSHLAESAQLLKANRLAEASEVAVEVRREAEAIVQDVRRATDAMPGASQSKDVSHGGSGGFAAL